MKVYPECLPCFALQALHAANYSTDNESLKWEILGEACKQIATFKPGMKPVEMAEIIYPLVAQKTGVYNPYETVKHETNQHALALYPFFKALVAESNAPLETAVKLSIIGNSIDFGVPHNHLVNLRAETLAILHEPLAIDDTNGLFSQLTKAKSLLLLADNSGEIVLDRLLLETIQDQYSNLKITVAVRDVPIINDVTLEDIRETKFPASIPALSSGNKTPGVILKKANKEFLNVYTAADIILSKGQGNYEGLSDEADERIFFLFRAKCTIIARHAGVKEGTMIVKKGGGK
jgi:uncharacterized protein with ATP-grasp and redox domains